MLFENGRLENRRAAKQDRSSTTHRESRLKMSNDWSKQIGKEIEKPDRANSHYRSGRKKDLPKYCDCGTKLVYTWGSGGWMFVGCDNCAQKDKK